MKFEDFAAARLATLLRYAVLLTGDREQARDLVQEVLTRALMKWDRIGALDEPSAYVRRMTTNEFLSWLRRRRLRTVPLHDDDPAGWVATESPSDEMWDLLGTLPARQRAVLVLRFYEGLPDPDIAEVLGCRLGTVRSNASRAYATLRIELTNRAAQEARL